MILVSSLRGTVVHACFGARFDVALPWANRRRNSGELRGIQWNFLEMSGDPMAFAPPPPPPKTLRKSFAQSYAGSGLQGSYEFCGFSYRKNQERASKFGSILGHDWGLVNNRSAAARRAPNWTGHALNSS